VAFGLSIHLLDGSGSDNVPGTLAVSKALSKTDMVVAPTQQARNSVVNDNRPACCGNHICIPVCPIQAKYDATVHVAKAEAAPTPAHVVENAVV
jgi:hypothetical protein